MSHAASVRFTYQDYLNLPEDHRYEIIEGDLLMSPSPSKRHQRIVRRLLVLLSEFVERRKLGEVFVSPYDVVISNTDVVQPDLLFISAERSDVARERAVQGAPDLVVEVLSSSTAERDRTVKTKLYARAGVRELWLVDPDAKTLEVLVNTPTGFRRESLFSAGQTARSPMFPGLTFEVDGLLA